MAQKAKPLAVHIVLETSALFTDAADKLIKQELSELIQGTNERSEFNVTWHLPDIVKEERRHQMSLRAQRADEEMRQPGAEREGTHGPRLANAGRGRGCGEACALLIERSSDAYCARSRIEAKECIDFARPIRRAR
jgi:hypothetical protein